MYDSMSDEMVWILQGRKQNEDWDSGIWDLSCRRLNEDW